MKERSYKLPLSDADVKTLVDDATAALDAGDEDEAIVLARMLRNDIKVFKRARPHYEALITLFARLLKPCIRRRIVK